MGMPSREGWKTIMPFDFKKQCKEFYLPPAKPGTVDAMHAFIAEQGFELDFSETRRHHEIYLSDASKTAPEKLRTVIRHPVRKA